MNLLVIETQQQKTNELTIDNYRLQITIPIIFNS